MKTPQISINDRSVLHALSNSPKPLSAYEILDRARSETMRAPVQVYRALEKLESRGLVHRIEALNAFVACNEHDERCRDEDHSHARHRPCFVICRDCGWVREFEDRRVGNTARKAAGEGFTIDLVSLEVYGRCATCQAAR